MVAILDGAAGLRPFKRRANAHWVYCFDFASHPKDTGDMKIRKLHDERIKIEKTP